MSDFCSRPKSPLLSYLICMPGTVGSSGTTTDMDYWEDSIHLVTFPYSIMVIIPHNLIKHTPAWLPTCKTDSLIQCPYFCSYCGMAQHRKASVWQQMANRQKWKGPTASEGAGRESEMYFTMVPTRLFSAYRNQLWEAINSLYLT